MIKITLPASLILVSISVFGQEVVSSQGGSYSNSNGSVDFTIGEPIIETLTDGTNDITQGFHQTNWNFAGLEDFDENVEAQVYPNPFENTLHIRTKSYSNTSYVLYDERGRLVSEGTLSGVLTKIKTEMLTTGKYTLNLNQNNQPIKSFKLIKVR